MENKKQIKIVIDILKNEYPEAGCTLIYNSPIQMLIAARLSAQCTDARVNLVTPALFAKYKTVYDFAKADPQKIEKYIYSCGFYNMKSKDIVGMSQKISEKHNGIVPDNIEELTDLPGVGRKTANLILGEIYKKPAVITDTHFIRVTGRLGFHNTKNAAKVENIMRKILTESESTDFCHRILAHGRLICKSQNPECHKCVLSKVCDYNNKTSA